MVAKKSKWSRAVVGSVMKSKNPDEMDYIKMRDGKTYKLENKDYQLSSARKAHAEGKFDDNALELMEQRINKIPEYVRFEIVEIKKLEE